MPFSNISAVCCCQFGDFIFNLVIKYLISTVKNQEQNYNNFASYFLKHK